MDTAIAIPTPATVVKPTQRAIKTIAAVAQDKAEPTARHWRTRPAFAWLKPLVPQAGAWSPPATPATQTAISTPTTAAKSTSATTRHGAAVVFRLTPARRAAWIAPPPGPTRMAPAIALAPAYLMNATPAMTTATVA